MPDKTNDTVIATVMEQLMAEGIPSTENRTVGLKRLKNEELRSREHLTPGEIELLLKTARSREGRYGHRDATMILVCYRHVLRIGELCALRWDQFDLEGGLVHVRRLKNGRPSVHPIRARGSAALNVIHLDTSTGSDKPSGMSQRTLGGGAAIAYTLAETAKLNGVDPQGWLADVLSKVADHKITKIDELVPWRYAGTPA
jgi:integrase